MFFGNKMIISVWIHHHHVSATGNEVCMHPHYLPSLMRPVVHKTLNIGTATAIFVGVADNFGASIDRWFPSPPALLIVFVAALFSFLYFISMYDFGSAYINGINYLQVQLLHVLQHLHRTNMLGVNRKNSNFFQTSWLRSNKNACSKALAIACSYFIESKFTTNVTFCMSLKNCVSSFLFSFILAKLFT